MFHGQRMLYRHKGVTPIKENSEFLEDQIYVKTCLENGENLLEPRIELSTIHGAKGRECENVVILSDISKRVWQNMQDNPDEENRVLYVGLTRAIDNLYVISPQKKYYFDI